ncbi:MAG TPA: ferritin-like domain-containing protein [Thermoleophilaceae bacterium]|nr:ferritin-like domain-containing protein [Thermoleophilaceae bacterium]
MNESKTRAPHEVQRSALDELRQEPGSRAQFLKMVGGAGAAGALSVLIAACGGDDEKDTSSSSGSSSSGSSGGGASKADLEIVNYALTLEYLEADFYQQVLDSGEVKDKKVGEVAMEISENEQEHVAALMATVEKLGGKPAARPTTNFDSVLEGGEKKILETAATVENLGAAAYLGQAGRIKSKEILAAALSIHTVEARHAAVLNQVVGKTIVPDGAFAKPAAMPEVLKAVKPFIKS